MNMIKSKNAQSVLDKLHKDAKNDYAKMAKGVLKSVFKPVQPKDFEQVYLPISAEQGKTLKELIIKNNCQTVIEFGTSFGISTIYMAEAVKHTGGKVITTELISSKAKRAAHNIAEAGLESYVEIRVGDAMQTLSKDTSPIDFLFLDGWKDLYLPLFKMLEARFHANSLIYADNMDMAETRPFANYLFEKASIYTTESIDGGKAFLCKRKSNG